MCSPVIAFPVSPLGRVQKWQLWIPGQWDLFCETAARRCMPWLDGVVLVSFRMLAHAVKQRLTAVIYFECCCIGVNWVGLSLQCICCRSLFGFMLGVPLMLQNSGSVRRCFIVRLFPCWLRLRSAHFAEQRLALF